MANFNFWLGSEEGFHEYIEQMRRVDATPRLDLAKMTPQVMSEDMRADSGFGGMGYMVSRQDNVALVTVEGSLVTKYSPWNPYFGLVSYDEIRSAVYAAATADDVDSVVLYMRTPGGNASGIEDTGEFIKKVDSKIKPVYSFTDTSMLSGGYWLGSYGREIYSSRLAAVGSIGVILVHMSIAEMLKEAGVEATVIRKGEFKALGTPYEKLDSKAREQIEGQMGKIYDEFLATVSENRDISVEMLLKTAAEGRVFLGTDALTVGLVDKVMSFDDALSEISEASQTSPTQAVTHPVKRHIGVDDMKRALTEAGIAAVASGASEEEVLQQPGMSVEVADEDTASVVDEELDSSESDDSSSTDEDVSAEADGDKESPKQLTAMLDKMFTLQAELAEVKVELKQAKSKADSMQANEESLKEIAVTAINRMQVALGGQPIGLHDSPTDAVIETHHKVLNSFNTKFRPRAVAETASDNDIGASREFGKAGSTTSVVDQAGQRLTSAIRN